MKLKGGVMAEDDPIAAWLARAKAWREDDQQGYDVAIALLCEVEALLGDVQRRHLATLQTPRQSLLDIQALRANLHATFNGGHQGSTDREAFHHGMDTVCNVLDAYQKGEHTNGILPQSATGQAQTPLP